jgi:class 3 adenylate cyclase
LTEEEVATRAGTTPQRVRELADLGILAPGRDADGAFRTGDAYRVQLVEELERSGIPATSVAKAMRDGSLSLAYLDKVPSPPPRIDQTHAELCEELGIAFDLLDRIYIAFGLPRPQLDGRVREDDLEIISGLRILFAAGLGEAEVLRAARVWGEGPRRVAQHQVHSFHALLEEPFRRQGLSNDQALDAALSQVGVHVIPYCERLVGWVYRRHFETYAIEHRLDHIETALDSAGLHRQPASHPEACVFADLSGYTTLTEQLGDAAAAQIALGLAELMQDVATHHTGRVVKMLGDGVHFFFHDARNAVLASLEFVEGVEPRGLPPAHVGVNAGPMTYTDGDYYGLVVNIAARIASTAGPRQVLVGESVTTAGNPEGVRFQELGLFPLKGVARPTKVFQALRTPD